MSNGGMKSVETAWNRFGSLINTTLILVAAAGILIKYGGDRADTANAIKENAARIEAVAEKSVERWQGHEAYHRDRLAEVKAREGNVDARFASIEDRLQLVQQLAFRMQAVETQVQAMNTGFSEMRKDVATVVTAVEVIRQYIEQERREARRRVPG